MELPEVQDEDEQDLEYGGEKLKTDHSTVSASGYSVQIPGWPTCHHNVAWSEDSELAIAANDHVELMIPRVSLETLKSFFRPTALSTDELYQLQMKARSKRAAADGVSERVLFGSRSGSGGSLAAGRTEDSRWTRFSVRTNLFKETEMPLLQPIQFDSLSLGEEQSNSHILSIAWSDSGLSYNKGCTLGILTANGAVSVWDARNGKRDVAGEWKRLATVNQAIHRWIQTLSTDNGIPRKEWHRREWMKRQQLRTRLRSFAWLPTPRSARARQMLVVSNDLLELIVVEVQRTENNTNELQLNVCHRAELSQLLSSHLLKAKLESVRGPPRFAQYLACSSFISWDDQNAQGCFIAYILADKLFLSRCIFTSKESFDKVELASNIWHIDGESSRFVGPLKWTEANAGRLCLISCGQDHIVTIHLNVNKQDQTQTAASHGLKWDSVAAWAITETEGSCLLHYAPHMSYAGSPCMSRDLKKSQTSSQSEWANRVQERKAGFSAEFGLGQDVAGRIWGMASSPIGSSVAICMTLHPAKMLQYQLSAYEHCHVMVSDETETLPTRPRARDRRTSTESLLATFSRWLRGRINREPLTIQDFNLVDAFLSTHTHLQLEQNAFDDRPTPKVLEQKLTQVNGYHAWLRFHLHGIMKGLNVDLDLPTVEEPERQTRLNLSVTAFGIGTNQTKQTLLGDRIMSLYKAAPQVLRMPEDGNVIDVDHGTSLSTTSRETCEMCSAEIPFESADWARCLSGHAFGRCNMTFLAIQEPGITRYCHICEKRYLTPLHLLSNDQKSPEDSNAMPNASEAIEEARSSSLVELLIDAFETCIYCNGRLVG